MLNIQQIEQQYPDNLRPFKHALLREYLQYKILDIIFASEYATKLSFLGGTALRILYGNSRFSEYLDFDNFNLDDGEFAEVAEIVKIGLEQEGLKVEISLAGKDAYRCNIRFPDILFANNISPHIGEKIILQIDSFAHGFHYIPDKKIINKFDVFTEIFATPLDILLSQKLYAAVNRKRAKGRDFFDIVFLLSITKPNYPYLKEKLGVTNGNELRQKFAMEIANIDFVELGDDVRNFLFTPSDVKRVEMFSQFIKEVDLG